MPLYVRIKKRLGSFLLDADFSSDNDRLSLLGASGSGKSVTLRCVAGIMTPDEGYIELDGKVLFDSRRRIDLPPQKRRIGYLFQQYALFPNMTVRQNIKTAVRDRAKKDETAERLIRSFQLEDVSASRPPQLSGGQQQRLALARILASDPKMLLLDEPFSALDSFLKSQLEQELRDLLDGFGGNVIWVSHDRDEVFRNCNKICVLDGGKSQSVVTPHELFCDPQTLPAAKLSGCKNVLKAVPSGSFVYVPDWDLTLKCARRAPPDTSAIGLRAHHIHFAEEHDENAVRCSVVRTMDNVFSTIVVLRPAGAAPGCPTLRMETGKELWERHKAEETLTVSVAPEDVLLLK